jgi:predicted nucleotidyltransferase
VNVPDSQGKATTAFQRLKLAAGREWLNVTRSQAASAEQLAAIDNAVAGVVQSGEAALVIFGSLARGEYTSGSDVDWSLLIDGRVDSKHLEVAQELRRRMEDLKLPQPGATQLFGGLIFSHDLVHAIGGQEDTNNNMTRRLLLLLESATTPRSDSQGVRWRTIRAVLRRYVDEDASFLNPSQIHAKIPRFLLNDVVRFWRTMAVDYANKYREQARRKWAIRNIKLRMSRKLLFVSGLLMCVTWPLEHVEGGSADKPQQLVEFLEHWVQRPALESLCGAIERFGPDLAAPLLDSYDEFLGLLGDARARRELEGLDPEGSAANSLFMEARRRSEKYDVALRDLLFNRNESLSQLVHKYGVF